VGVTAGASERHDMKILHLDSSVLGVKSASRAITDAGGLLQIAAFVAGALNFDNHHENRKPSRSRVVAA
jgi:hypothetical protein